MQVKEAVQEGSDHLERELRELQAQIDSLEAQLQERPDYGLGRGAPAVTRWEMNLALLERLKEQAARLQRAQSRLDDGTYGICAQCGESIHPERLALLPATALCVRCARSRRQD
jgi:RNA polymerase-binding transcription factor DksA